MDSDQKSADNIPQTCLPPWTVKDLPEPKSISWRNIAALIGPGIVMCGIQIAGGEWLVGPEITARYGGGLMWIATISILVQVFYNMECGRYALYSGEPIMTGFLRSKPGPRFWVGVFLLLSTGAIIPGMSTQAATVITAMIVDRPPTGEDRVMVMALAYVLFGAVTIPVLVGGKIYNTIQAVMTTKVVIVLGFCLIVGVFYVPMEKWVDVFSGFFKFGNVPVEDGDSEKVVNAFSHYMNEGEWPVIALANIAVLGAFAGYAGGGGLGNSTYSNYVRDKGWGMGSLVGAIPSAVGSQGVTLSHLGIVFPINEENLRKWKIWWKYILTDQWIVWAPGCFVGMALPALLSIQFAQFSPVFQAKSETAKAAATAKLDGKKESDDNHAKAEPADKEKKSGADQFRWSQPVIAADGMRHAPMFSPGMQRFMWLVTCIIGLIVLLPSQMSIVENFSRRWTDVIWSANSRVREKMKDDQIKSIYYAILFGYVAWCLIAMTIFSYVGTPKLMILIIANLNNLAIGFTAFFIIRVNTRMLPKELRPKWYNKLGLICCGVFYMGLALLVFFKTQVPLFKQIFFAGE